MPNELSEDLTDLKRRDDEVQEAFEHAVENALADTELVSVHNVTQGTSVGSVKIQLRYRGLEDLLTSLDEFQGLDISVRNGDIYVNPEGN